MEYTMQTKSIFNPEITITEDQYAVSFVRNEIGTVHTSMSQHGFLVIQAPNMLYRKEILYDADDNPGFAIVIEDERSVTSPEKLQAQFNLLIWKNIKTAYTLANLGHHTWSISKEQCLELFADIDKDISNPPKFFIHGNYSVIKPGDFEKRVKYTTGLVGSNVVLQSCLLLSAPAAVTLPAIAFASTITSVSALGFFLLTELNPNINKAHNCGTWCVEKLTNLNIPAINKDLGLHFTDIFSYVTGIHIHANIVDAEKAHELLTKGIKKEAYRKLNVCTVEETTDNVNIR